MKQLHCLSVRSVPGTRGPLSRPAYARGLNNVPHTMMSFGERVTSPRTAAFAAFFNASRRLRRSLCTVLLTGMLGLALLLAGCAGSDDPTPPAAGNSRAVTNVQTLVGDGSITVAWTNPEQTTNISMFNVTLFDDKDPPAIIGPFLLDAGDVNFTGGARVIYPIPANLTNGVTYRITIAVIYDNGDSVGFGSVESTPGVGDAGKGFGDDLDDDGFLNDDDAFDTDACAKDDADKDGMPDRLVDPDCNTPLTVDPDGGFPAVLNVVATPAGNNITVSWTNPNRAGTGFNIAWVNVNEDAEAADTGTKALSATEADVAAGAADNTYKITGLTYAATYNITVAVLYADGTSSDPVSVQAMTGTDPEGRVEPVTPITDDRAVADIQTAVSGNNITVSWINPDQEGQDEITGFITGFNVTWFNVDNESDGDTAELNATLADVAPGARVSYNITGLLYNATYAITIAVLYADGTSVVSSPVQNTTGMDPNGGGGGLGGDPSGGSDPTFPAVSASDIQTTVSGNTITVNWTNPNLDGQADIIEFNVAWANDANATDRGEMELDSDEANVTAGASDNSYTIPNLTYDATYEITVAVRYAGRQDPVLSTAVEGTIGADPNPAIPNPQAMVSGNNITVSWTNPNRDGQDEIIGFHIIYVNVDNSTDGDTKELDSDEVNITAGAGNRDTITDLTYRATYEITIAVRYAGRQDPVPSATVERTIGADPNADDDGDGRVNREDVDDDNNGLIEIHTLDDLARLRVDLNGDGIPDGNIGEVTPVGSTGCPSGGCAGYELARSLNFSDADSYADGSASTNMDDWTARDGSGWAPIGSCSAQSVCTPYTSVFDGGGYAIADLFISVNNSVSGVGLFGALNGTIQNLHLLNAHVSGGEFDLGMLAGYSIDSRFENLSVVGGVIMNTAASKVGGLIGDAVNVDIRAVSVSDIILSTAGGALGGLAGSMAGSDVRAVSMSDIFIFSVSSTLSNAGGMIGFGSDTAVHNSYLSRFYHIRERVCWWYDRLWH